MIFNRKSLLAALCVVPAALAREPERTNLRRLPVSGNCNFKGNGFPQGKTDFKLNILGRDLNKKEDWNFNPNPGNADNIAVDLNGRTKIFLENSDVTGNVCEELCPEGFCVADPNGTDGDGATLCLKDPFAGEDPCDIAEPTSTACTEEATYRIFARVRGKGQFSARLCVEEEGSGDYTYCPVGVVTVSDSTKGKAVDVSQELLTLCLDYEIDGTSKQAGVGLFDTLCLLDDGTTTNIVPCYEEGSTDFVEQYFWDWVNDNTRNAELRFYNQEYLDSLVDDPSCWTTVTRGKACGR